MFVAHPHVWLQGRACLTFLSNKTLQKLESFPERSTLNIFKNLSRVNSAPDFVLHMIWFLPFVLLTFGGGQYNADKISTKLSSVREFVLSLRDSGQRERRLCYDRVCNTHQQETATSLLESSESSSWEPACFICAVRLDIRAMSLRSTALWSIFA